MNMCVYLTDYINSRAMFDTVPSGPVMGILVSLYCMGNRIFATPSTAFHLVEQASENGVIDA